MCLKTSEGWCRPSCCGSGVVTAVRSPQAAVVGGLGVPAPCLGGPLGWVRCAGPRPVVQTHVVLSCLCSASVRRRACGLLWLLLPIPSPPACRSPLAVQTALRPPCTSRAAASAVGSCFSSCPAGGGELTRGMTPSSPLPLSLPANERTSEELVLGNQADRPGR